MAVIDYFFTVTSPFTYLAGDRLEEIAARRGATIAYKPVDMSRVFAATGGLPLPQRPPARQAYRLQELARIARRTGMKLNIHPAHWPTDPGPAARAIVAADKAGGGDVGRLARALMAACWAEEKDVARPEVVAAALAACGYDAAALAAGMEAAGPVIEGHTDEAIARGVFGAPFYIVGEEKFWGQDRLSYLDEHLGRL